MTETDAPKKAGLDRSISRQVTAEVDDEPITPDVLRLWLRRAQRKFKNGVTVIRVTQTGKLVRRQLFLGAKPDYLELISAKLFDIAYHYSDITDVIHGIDSPDFAAFKECQTTRTPKHERSLVVRTPDKTISLVFLTESDRRDAQFLLLVERRAYLLQALSKSVSTADS